MLRPGNGGSWGRGWTTLPPAFGIPRQAATAASPSQLKSACSAEPQDIGLDLKMCSRPSRRYLAIISAMSIRLAASDYCGGNQLP